VLRLRKVQEFRQRARECRVAAAKAPNGELRIHYQNLANVWEKLADERLAFFVEHPATKGERERKHTSG
jgi:hypothetical protein